jgi:glycosyltransferase involved in cell wall biosynthesis
MKICFVTESFYPEIDGGAVHSRLLAEKFHDAGHDVLIVTRRPRPSYPRNEVVSGCPVIRAGLDDRYGMVGRYLGMLSVLPPLIAHRRQYNIALISAPRILGAPVVVLMKLLGKKCIIKPDSCGEMDGTYALNQIAPGSLVFALAIVYFRLRNFFLKRADAYIAISSIVSDEICNMGIESRLIKIIPNGVDINKFMPHENNEKRSLRVKHGLQEKAIIFAYCGRLTREKGLISLLRVWKTVTDNFDNTHLLLIGSGENMSLDCEDQLRDFVKENGLDKFVTFTGPVEDVSSYLGCADIFVLPSLTEALGIALIEAQLCGIPAIATRVGGIPDIITHNVNGLLVAPDNDNELSNAAVELISNSAKRVKLGLAARKSGVERFSITRVTESYLSLLNAVVCNTV